MGFFDVVSGASLAFPTIGTRAGGTITAVYETRQSNDFITEKPKVDDRGNPVMMACVPIQTAERDPAVPDDDGLRTLYVDKVGQKIAIRDAIRKSGAADLEVGGQLWVTWTGETPSTKGSPLKNWAAEYIRPVGSLGVTPTPNEAYGQGAYASPPAVTPTAPVDVSGFAGPPAASVVAPAQPQLPTPAATPLAPASSIDALAKVKKLLGTGFDAATIHELVPEMSLDMIAAISNI